MQDIIHMLKVQMISAAALSIIPSVRLTPSLDPSDDVHGVHNSLQPLPRLHRCLRDLQSSQRNAIVQSLQLAGNFFVQPIAAECWRGRGGKLSRKTQYLMNTLYLT